MKVVAIVQARVGSSRLPAKVLLDLLGKTALERCLRRVAQIPRVAEVVVATSTAPADDLIASASKRYGFAVFRGSEDDVLARYAGAAKAHGAEAIVRCTSDCPLLDPEVSGSVVEAFLAARGASTNAAGADYASNTIVRRFPRGLDTEVFTVEALVRADADASSPAEREHVTAHLYARPERFRVLHVGADAQDHSPHRWTLDTLDDYRFLAAVFDELGAGAETAKMADVLAVLARRPELVTINAHVEQKKL
jgi:spore coat polysaccharide biosynthesis protein SpsF